MNQLIKGSVLQNIVTVAAGAAAATALNGDVIDLAGLEGAMIIIALGPIVAGAVTSVKLQHGDVSTGPTVLTDAADILGSNMVIADTDDNTVVVFDVRKPKFRYLRIAVSRATQNATLTAIAIGYGARYRPTTQPAGVATKVIANPTSGTA